MGTTDPLGNEIHIKNDYRLLQRQRITDPNGSVTEVRFDTRGMVAATALHGNDANPTGDGSRELQSLHDARGRIVGWFSWAGDRGIIGVMNRLWGILALLGAALGLCAVFVVRSLRRLSQSLDRSTETVRKLTSQDPLTGLPNHRMTIESLGRENIARLAEAVIDPAKVGTPLVDWLMERSQGSPLYALGLMRALPDDGEAPGRWIFARLGDHRADRANFSLVTCERLGCKAKRAT